MYTKGVSYLIYNFRCTGLSFFWYLHACMHACTHACTHTHTHTHTHTYTHTERPEIYEMTVLGAAIAAGIALNVWEDIPKDIPKLVTTPFKPADTSDGKDMTVISVVPRLWYTLFAYAPSPLGNMHILLCYTKINGNFCLPAEWLHCGIILPVRHLQAVLKSETKLL